MTGFDRVSLPILAVFTVLGLVAPFALTAKTRLPLLVIVALVVGAWAVIVFVSAAVIM